jgi:hypothetical protein
MCGEGMRGVERLPIGRTVFRFDATLSGRANRPEFLFEIALDADK